MLAAPPPIRRSSASSWLLDEFGGAGTATALNRTTSLDTASRRPARQFVAWGSDYDQRQYYPCRSRDEVLLHPMGRVYLEARALSQLLQGRALDRIGVTVKSEAGSDLQSAAEPYIANEASPASREADAFLLGALWTSYTDAVEKARKLPAGSIVRGIDELPQRFAAVGGDSAKLALNEKLVDGLKTRDELRALLIARGAQDAERKTFRQISFAEYLGAQAERPAMRSAWSSLKARSSTAARRPASSAACRRRR